MFIRNIIIIKITLITFSIQVVSKNPVFTINGKKLLHTSDAAYLSYIVDYNSTVEFISKGFSSIQLAQTLSPSSIRITDAFPSINSSNLTIQQWNSINDWFLRSNLNPIYVIESQATNRSTAWLSYLKAHKQANNSNIFWELHYDCGNVNENILLTVRKLLNINPDLISNLKIVQSNLSFCFSDQNQELLHDKLLIKELNYSVDVMTYEERANMNETEKFYVKTKIPIWFKLETQNETLNFEETLIWFNKIEKIGRNGFASVFRQSKWGEIIADNPLYWVTMIYKSLVSPKILDIRPPKSRDLDLNVFAHCTNNQNKFSSEDSMTIIATNCDDKYQNFTIRISPPHSKSIEVLLYIVSSSESTSTLLNGEKLTFESIFNNHTLKPKIKTVRVINHLVPLSLSANSIGFFVIKTKVPACTNKIDNSANNSKLSENLIIIPNAEDSQKYVDSVEIQSTNSETTKNPTAKILNLEIIYAEHPNNSREASISAKKIELKLTDDEIRQILLNRAKAKANELNITITSKEIENEILREVKNLTKIQERPKRDINMKELKKHTMKTQVKPKMYDKKNKYDLDKKQLRNHVPRGRYAEYDEEQVTKKYIEDNVKFLMGPNYSSDESYSSHDEYSNRQAWNSDIDEENIRNAVRLLENYMENSRSSEEIQYYNKYAKRFKRSLNDDQIRKYKQFMIDQLRIISNLRKNPILKIANVRRKTSNLPETKMFNNTKFSTQNSVENSLLRELRNSASRRFKRTNNNDLEDYFKSRRLNKHKRKNAVSKIKKNLQNKKSFRNFSEKRKRIFGKPHSKIIDKRSADNLVNSRENQIENDLYPKFKKDFDLEIMPTGVTISKTEEAQTKSSPVLQNAKFNESLNTIQTNSSNYLETKKNIDLFDSLTKYIKDLFVHIYNEVVNYFQ